MLRQNPHNVAEWHKRAKLFEGQPTKQARGAATRPATAMVTLRAVGQTPKQIATA
jgi:pre-mRNA-splicing factor SYF1